MKRYSLAQIRRTQKGRGFWLRLSNEAASRLIYAIQDMRIHPNWFTLASLIFGVCFGVALVRGHEIAAAIFLNLLYLFDNVDGQWARIKKMSSPFGALFDSLVDGWNISIIVFSMGMYLFEKTGESLYLYVTILFFLISFLDFALEKNAMQEGVGNEGGTSSAISLQQSSSRLRPLIRTVDALTMYDKWIFFITLGLLFGHVEWALFYVTFVRLMKYALKLFKLYLRFR